MRGKHPRWGWALIGFLLMVVAVAPALAAGTRPRARDMSRLGDIAEPRAFCVDLDGDLWFVEGGGGCAPGTQVGDCNDSNPAIFPGAIETCNGIDDDCDLSIDEGLLTTYYNDDDGDGYGDPAEDLDACTAPPGFVTNDDDCDDDDDAVHPGATELCNAIDDDCDLQFDEGFAVGTACDGVGACDVGTVECSATFTAQCSTDPGGSADESATEVCANALDDDCDGSTDEAAGTTRYVATTGSDALNPCDLAGTPCATVQHAVDVACVGDTVEIGPGTFTENVTLPKRLTLDGAGIATTILQSAAAGADVLHITASGASAVDRVVVRDLRVTGATGSGDAANGIDIALGGSHYTFDHVAALANGGNGIGVSTTGAVSDVVITSCDLSGNGLNGFNISSSVASFVELDMTGGTVDNNGENGIQTGGSGSPHVDDIAINGTSFTGNGAPAPGGGAGDISLFQFNGDAEIRNVSIHADGRIALQIRGGSPAAPAGTVVLDNVSIDGTTSFSAISLLGYSSVAAISFNDVSINTTSAFGLFIEALGSTLNLGDTAFAGTHTAQRTIANVSTGAVDATGTSWDGVAAAGATLAELFVIEDRIGHSIDAPGGGLVRVRAGNVYVTPLSFAAPFTTSARVQRGVDAASSGDNVRVQAGVYTEQIAIAKSVQVIGEGVATTSIVAPAAMTPGPIGGGFAIVTVSGAGVAAELTALKVAGPGPGGCASLHYGILVVAGADAFIHDAAVAGIRDTPFGGCQNGIAIRVGLTSPASPATATITGNELSDYQKGGIDVRGAGSVATITGNFVHGVGPQVSIAQNGIFVLSGARADIIGNTVTGHECDHPTCGPDFETEYQSIGIALFDSAATSSITGNHLSTNDIGIYSFAAGTTPISDNDLTDNRYEGILLDEGTQQLEDNTISGGNIGVLVVSFGGFALGDTNATLLRNVITGTGTGIQILDTAPPDAFEANLTANNNHIFGNLAGVDNATAVPADANCNWWGAADGPGPVGPGSGDPISAGVMAVDWLLAADFGADTDSDGKTSCTSPGNGDCNNGNSAIFPGATQVCDGVNNDCSFPGWPSTVGTNEFDDDTDTFSECGGDCNDAVVAINPDAEEVCNNVDDDCDAVIDGPLADASCHELPSDNACTNDVCAAGGVCDNSDPSGVCGFTGKVYYDKVVAGADTLDLAKPVEGALVSVSGDTVDSDTTDATGSYSIPNVAGNVSVEADKLVVVIPSPNDWDTSLSSQDASNIAKFSVGNLAFTPLQIEAGDVSDLAGVTSFDASLVAQKVVDQGVVFPASTNSGSDWAFSPVPVSYTPISGAQALDIVAVVYGDVTLGWTNPVLAMENTHATTLSLSADAQPAPPAVSSGAGERDAVLYLAGAPLSLAGGSLQYTLGLMNADGIQALDVRLAYDPSMVTIKSIRTAGIASGFAVATGTRRGETAVAVYGPGTMAGTGTFLVVTITENRGFKGLPFEVSARANEGAIRLVVEPAGPSGPTQVSH